MTQHIVISMGVHHLVGFVGVFAPEEGKVVFTHFVRGYWSTWMYQKISKWFVKGI